MFTLSGRIERQAIAELKRLCENQTDILAVVLDLKNVGVIDRDAMRFFMRCESEGMKLENCPSYVREWIEREKD